MEGFEIQEVEEAEDAMYQGGCRGYCLSNEDVEE